MLNKEIEIASKKIEKQLKPFQKASVDYVIKQFEEKGRNKVLIADEVGLGKTIIAKGVISKMLELKASVENPYHVVYICSNQILAQQNIQKLNPLDNVPESLSRLIYLSKKMPVKKGVLKMSSLSPGTSFELSRSMGNKEERAIIVGLLSNSFGSWFSSYIDPLKIFFKGNIKNIQDWENLSDNYIGNRNDIFHEGLPNKFSKHLKAYSFSSDQFKYTSRFLENKKPQFFYDALKEVLKRVKRNPAIDISDIRYEIIRFLRLELTKVCLEFLDADLFILDEFQRFKSLLDGENNSEAGELAKMVLQQESSNVLLLSATPFKPFTTQLEQLNGEDHFDEFQKIVEFIGGKNGKELWSNFKKDQQAFFQLLRHPGKVLEFPNEANIQRNNLEVSFKKFLSRNERMNIAEEYDNMTDLAEESHIDITSEDVKNFIVLDQLCQELKTNSPNSMRHFGSTLEFAKSAPYPLSYLYGYKLHHYIDSGRKIPEIQNILAKHKNAWISYEKIQSFTPIGYNKEQPAFPNGKFRALAHECFKDRAEFLLWVPTSKPFYKPFGVFEGGDDFSKILIFSNWAMVPRAVSTLLSYDVERRTIGAENIENVKETEERKYYSKPRKPGPLLLYKNNDEQDTSVNMTNFILTYPSVFGYSLNILNQSSFPQAYSELKNLQKEILQIILNEKLRKKYIKKDNGDKTWYWIALHLLDFIINKKTFKNNLKNLSGITGGAERNNISFLQEYLQEIEAGTKLLGEFPEDLFEVLANVILSSPANASLFSIKNNLAGNEIKKEEFSNCFKIADAFIAHFNKPESIAAIRLSTLKKDYWRQVLEYCAAGNIAAMLTEYFYLLVDGENKGIAEISDLLQNILTTRPSNVQVDMKKKSGVIKPYNMRCHFAVAYGTQKMNSDAGKDRMVNLRTVFNSPFRPFVLTSTSIGQEGLDFHYYCSKIFHWNLPHNPIDLEQREGRINRYKGLVIRRKITEIITNKLPGATNMNLWGKLFEVAESRSGDKTGIKPFWYLDEGKAKIKRFVPIHELSKDNERFSQLKSSLALYRLTFGQPRQEELIEAIKSAGLTEDEVNQLRKDLLINLSPLERNSFKVEELAEIDSFNLEK